LNKFVLFYCNLPLNDSKIALNSSQLLESAVKEVDVAPRVKKLKTMIALVILNTLLFTKGAPFPD